MIKVTASFSNISFVGGNPSHFSRSCLRCLKGHLSTSVKIYVILSTADRINTLKADHLSSCIGKQDDCTAHKSGESGDPNSFVFYLGIPRIRGFPREVETRGEQRARSRLTLCAVCQPGLLQRDATAPCRRRQPLSL